MMNFKIYIDLLKLLIPCAFVGLSVETGIIHQTMLNSSQTLGDLKIHYIDVDAPSDAILVELPDGNNMLIDAGHGNWEVGIVMDLLDTKGISTLDYVFGTHRHADHIGGMADIIDNYNIGVYYQPTEPVVNTPTENVIDALAAKSMSITTPVAGTDVFDINNGELKLSIIAPNGSGYDDANDYSIVLKLVYKDRSFLFTGDASFESEAEMLDPANGYDLSADVLKVGHHGSSSSSSNAFLTAVDPTYAIIPSDVDFRKSKKRGKVPSKPALDRLYAQNIDVFRAGEQGTIELTSDGTNITFNKSDVTLNDYYYGSQLPENQLPGKDYNLSNGQYNVVDNMVHFSQFSSNWIMKNGIIKDNKLVQSADGGNYQIATEGSNKLIKLTRDGSEDPGARIQVEKHFDESIFGNIRVKADIRLADNPNPDARTGRFYLLQKDDRGLPLIVAEFTNDAIILRNYASPNYPGAEAAVDLPQDEWFTVIFLINTRTAKFDTMIDGVPVGTDKMNLLNVLGDAHLDGLAFSATNDVTTFSIDNLNINVEDYLFAETFESQNFNQWDGSSTVSFTSGLAFFGDYSARFMNGGEAIVKYLSTEGYEDIAVDFTWRTRNLEGSEAIIALWYDGTDWHELARLNDYGNNFKYVKNYKTETFYLPEEASDNPDFRLRFRVRNGLGGDDRAFLDNVFIRGVPIE